MVHTQICHTSRFTVISYSTCEVDKIKSWIRKIYDALWHLLQLT